jgi:hypothetical protein
LGRHWRYGRHVEDTVAVCDSFDRRKGVACQHLRQRRYRALCPRLDPPLEAGFGGDQPRSYELHYLELNRLDNFGTPGFWCCHAVGSGRRFGVTVGRE